MFTSTTTYIHENVEAKQFGNKWIFRIYNFIIILTGKNGEHRWKLDEYECLLMRLTSGDKLKGLKNCSKMADELITLKLEPDFYWWYKEYLNVECLFFSGF